MKTSLAIPFILAFTSSILGQEALQKAPVPSDAAQADATKLIKEVYGDEYAKAKTPTEKRALAKTLLGKAKETQDDPGSKFVLLRLARDIASQACDGQTAFESIDAMAESFNVDAVEMETTVLLNGATLAQTDIQHKAIAEMALKVMDDAVNQDNFTVAAQLGRLARMEARKTGEKVLTAHAESRFAEIAEIAKLFEEVKTARVALVKTPDDSEANQVVGRYLCFTKGAWDKGLPMLALAKDEKLRALAGTELAGVASFSDQAKLGDGWWTLAENEDGTATKRIQARAAYWYQKALPGLSGIAKDKAEKRLRESLPLRTPQVATPNTLRADVDIAFEKEGVIDKTRITRPVISGTVNIVPGFAGRSAGRFVGGCVTLGTYDVGEKPFSLEVLVRPLGNELGSQHFAGWHHTGRRGALFFGRVGDSIHLGYPTASGFVERNWQAHLKAGRWYHIMLVRNQRAITVYVNGKEVVSSEPSVSNLPTTDFSLMIGNEGSRHAAFNGDIQFMRLYRNAITPQQVRALAKEVE